eukprot:5267387-Amphidinium_carterae.1
MYVHSFVHTLSWVQVLEENVVSSVAFAPASSKNLRTLSTESRATTQQAFLAIKNQALKNLVMYDSLTKPSWKLR